jgi:type IV pilus assembly protein PilM
MRLPARIAQLNRPVHLKRPQLRGKGPQLRVKRPQLSIKRPQLGIKRPQLSINRAQPGAKRPSFAALKRINRPVSLKRPQLGRKRPAQGDGGPRLSAVKRVKRPLHLKRPQLSLKRSRGAEQQPRERKRPQLSVKRPQLNLRRPGQVKLKLPSLSGLGRRSGGGVVVGLDIQPGFIAAVQAKVNGTIVAERAACVELAADTVRDGEVFDDAVLSDAIRELFRDSGLGKHVRVGVANQRTVLRTLELPPVTDQKELAAAVAFQAQDQVPMPLNNAVLDFHPLGIVDTPAGPRQRVVLVAAQRDMIERLLAAVRGAGLIPEGVDLSAFALIRSLYRHDPEQNSRVMYLNVDGLTNLAIAEGKVCRFTRVVGGGLEAMAMELAERRGIALSDARALVAGIDLRASEPAPQLPHEPPAPEAAVVQPEVSHPAGPEPGDEQPAGVDAVDPDAVGTGAEPPAMTLAEQAQAELAAAGLVASEGAPSEDAPAPAEPRGDYDFEYETGQGFEQPPPSAAAAADAADADRDVREVLENGIRDISGEVRNSLDFHRSQDGGGEVSHVILSGAAEEIPGFAELLQQSLGVEVRGQSIALADTRLQATVSQHRLAVAAGLATVEAPQ